MCGIAGVVGPGRRREHEQLTERMCERLRHRGPDALVVRTFGDATLGFARLSIIDLATGCQPLTTADEAVAVVMNGEIYNYLELRDELQAQGHRFRTGSDAEVVVHLYEDVGLGCLDRLNGMFALAIADGRTGDVHLVRDRVGVKPLFWALDGDCLTFASELPALLENRSIARQPDREALAELLTLTYLPAPRTAVAQVSKLEPGTVLSYRAGGLRVRRWWRWPAPGTDSEPASSRLDEQVRELVVDATRLQLRSDVPVGILLSGGVDSTALAWAARELGSDVPAYCVDFDEPEGDAAYAHLAGRLLGVQVQELPVDAASADRTLPDVVARLSEPLGDPAVLPSLLVCRAAASAVRVLLSGTGADELWGGYGRYVLPGEDPRSVYVEELSVLPEAEVRAALGLRTDETPVRDRLTTLLHDGGGDADPAAARMFLDGALSLPGDLLPLLDQTSMAVSIEARVPLLDHRLVELAAATTGATRIPGGALKGRFRSALRGCVPDAVLDRPKRGFNPPLDAWATTSLGVTAERLVTGPHGLTESLLDPAVVAEWLRPGAVSPGLRALRLWSLLVLDLWCRRVVSDEVEPSGSLSGLLADVA